MNLRVLATLGLIMSTPLSAELAPHIPGEVIVKLRGENLLRNKSITAGFKKITEEGVYKLKLNHQKSSGSFEQLLDELNGRSDVEYAEPNYIYTIGKPFVALYPPHKDYGLNNQTNDPQLNALWGLNNTGSNEPGSSTRGVAGADAAVFPAWNLTRGSRQIKIAVIDTGIDYRHEDLKDNMWVNTAEAFGLDGVDDDQNGYVDDVHGYDFANDDGDPMDGNGHGTHCAGTIGATHDNGRGVAGVMGEVSFVGLKFLSDQGSGSTENAIRAIDYAISAGVDIMSNSWGGGGASQALKEVIEKANRAGIIFTAAAGNSGTDNDTRPQYPANYDVENVISVAAHTAQNRLANFSCYGKNTVHVAAPGHNILSTYKNGQYEVLSGTSMATPHVSGALGLLLSYEGQMTPAEARERLMATSEPGKAYRSRTIAGGRLSTINLLNDERPIRQEPDPSAWKTKRLANPFESDHPYDVNVVAKRTFQVPNARYIRLVVKKYDLEERYDYLLIEDQNDEEVERISLSGNDYVSEYVDGDTINVTFRSDRSITKWGFLIEEIQYQ